MEASGHHVQEPVLSKELLLQYHKHKVLESHLTLALEESIVLTCLEVRFPYLVFALVLVSKPRK